MATLGGAESFEDALRKLAQQGGAAEGRGAGSRALTAGQVTARLCEHACLCFHLAGLPGAASAMHIAKEGCEKVRYLVLSARLRLSLSLPLSRVVSRPAPMAHLFSVFLVIAKGLVFERLDHST